MTTKNLNPDNLPDIAEALKKSQDEQLYFFLDDSIPHDDVTVILSIDNDKDHSTTEGVLCDFAEFTTTVVDFLFATKNKYLQEKGLEYMRPYIPMLQNCYRPYVWELSVHNLTPDQIQTLYKLRESGGCCVVEPKNAPENVKTVPAHISLIISSIQKEVDVVLYDTDK